MVFPARTLKDELLALETRQEQLQAELAAAPDVQQPLLHPALAEVYRDKVERLHEALADETVRDEVFELIRSLIDKVVVRPADDGLDIDLHGDLGAILVLCRHGKTPGGSRALAEQIKGVAGFATRYREQIRGARVVREGSERKDPESSLIKELER